MSQNNNIGKNIKEGIQPNRGGVQPKNEGQKPTPPTGGSGVPAKAPTSGGTKASNEK